MEKGKKSAGTARIKYNRGVTLSMDAKGGPKTYEMTRIDVEIVVPAPMEKLDAGFAFAKKWVCTRLAVEIAEVDSIREECGR